MRYLRRSLVLVLVAAALILLTACLGVDVSTRFNEDGSGTMTTKLRISQLFLQMGQEGGGPVPLTKEDLEAAYRGLEGVSVQSIDQESTEQDRIITSVVNFKSYTVFNNRKDLAGAGATLSTEQGRTVYRVMIGEPERTTLPHAGGEPVPPASTAAAGERGGSASSPPPAGAAEGAKSPDSSEPDETEQAMQAMMKSLVAGYALSYTVTAPTPILSHTMGELSADGTSVHYTITMADYIDLKRPVMLEVKW